MCLGCQNDGSGLYEKQYQLLYKSVDLFRGVSANITLEIALCPAYVHVRTLEDPLLAALREIICALVTQFVPAL